MMVKYFFYTSLCSLLLNSFSAVQAGRIEVQLIPDDQDLHKVRQATQTHNLFGAVPFPHITVLSIDDENESIQADFHSFAKKIDYSLRAAKEHMTFFGQGVKGYSTQKSGDVFWCLEDADLLMNTKLNEKKLNEKNVKIAAILLKKSLEPFVEKETPTPAMDKKPAFTMNNTNQVREAMHQKSQKDGQSYLEFSKGFPHMSVAKGRHILPSQFSGAEKQPLSLKLKGYRIIYTYSTDMFNKLPQVYLTVDLDKSTYNLHSEFTCLNSYRTDYNSIDALLGKINGINSLAIKQEIKELQQMQNVPQMLNLPQTQKMSQMLNMQKPVQAIGNNKRKLSEFKDPGLSEFQDPGLSEFQDPAPNNQSSSGRDDKIQQLKREIKILEMKKEIESLEKPKKQKTNENKIN